MLTEEQLEARKSGIGGSDVAAILGLSPWKSKHELYLEKRGEIEAEDISEKEIIIFGNLLEDVVASEYSRRNDVKVQRRNDMIKHPKYPWMLANIDRKVVGRKKGLECKTADKFTRGKWGEDGSDDIPDDYRCQSEHYMIVTGLPEWDLAVLIGGNEFRQYHLQQDKELSELLIEQEAMFWDAVQKGVPPLMDYDHPGTLDLLKRVYPGTNGQTIQMPEMEHWHKVKVEADEIVKQYSAVSDGCKARILHQMGENAVGIIPGAATQYKRNTIKRKEYTVEAGSYTTMRASAYKGD